MTTMSKIFTLALFCLSSLWIHASNIATQTITFSIDPISEITVSGDPPPLVAQAVSDGGNPANVSDNSTFYAITTNGSSQKITASLSAPMPNGTWLKLMATPPSGATCAGCLDLDINEQNIITGISQIAEGNLQLTYVFRSTAAAGIIPTTSRIVMFTLAP
jgi:hypothetical protein